MTLGGGVSGAMAIVFAWLISTFGWRDALLIAGLTQLVICLPLAISIRNRPSDMGLPVDGLIGEDTPAGDEEAAAAEMGRGWTTREAIRSMLFWRVALVYAFSNFATTAIIVHQVPFLTESVGASEGFAATTVTLMTGLSIIGRLGFGNAADVLPKRVVTAVALGAIALSVALFATIQETWQLIYVLPIFGIGFGGIIPVRSTLQAEYFGLRAFGAIQGMTLTISTVGAFTGPILAGWLYDISDSYRLAFLLLALGPLVAIPLILTARPAPAPAAL